ncbi:GTP 3',8-cyclase MoaA [Rubritalea tangerina]|uniref:GTP 3',8-cyclase n=2 Tax=Rubritalea tangerina TaxID=430798 RepID=A0ABW4ZCH1_9BACT
MSVEDRYQRPLRDLRISVTDRCNFRCRYCMPAEIFGADYRFLPREEILRFGEIELIARALVGLGVRKLRLTGGEPLVRRDLSILVEKLASIAGVEDIAMTTNASLLGRHAQRLKEAGLHRVTVSLDALDEAIFGQMNGVGARAQRVIEGIDTALECGLGVKVNAVIQKGVNDQEVLALAEFARTRKIPIRYIEFMDTGNTNGWKHEQVVPSYQVLESLREVMALEAVSKPLLGETAERYTLSGGDGFEVGFISSVSKPFCRDCNRLRLSAEGQLYTCLFAASGHDLKTLVREGNGEASLRQFVTQIWSQREDRYSELRSEGMAPIAKKEMSYLGG